MRGAAEMPFAQLGLSGLGTVRYSLGRLEATAGKELLEVVAVL
jgi:hypothetical protein